LSDSSLIKHLREELNSVDLPLLLLDGDCVDSTIDPCSTKTKIAAYIESLNSKKFGNIFGTLGNKIRKNNVKPIKNIIPFNPNKKSAIVAGQEGI
jgi:hypothetical protein